VAYPPEERDDNEQPVRRGPGRPPGRGPGRPPGRGRGRPPGRGQGRTRGRPPGRGRGALPLPPPAPVDNQVEVIDVAPLQPEEHGDIQQNQVIPPIHQASQPAHQVIPPNLQVNQPNHQIAQSDNPGVIRPNHQVAQPEEVNLVDSDDDSAASDHVDEVDPYQDELEIEDFDDEPAEQAHRVDLAILRENAREEANAFAIANSFPPEEQPSEGEEPCQICSIRRPVWKLACSCIQYLCLVCIYQLRHMAEGPSNQCPSCRKPIGGFSRRTV